MSARGGAPEGSEAAGGRWLRFEYTKCGRCVRCAAGRYVHGPYSYLYEYNGDRMRSIYIGRRMSEEVARALDAPGLAGKRPEDVYRAEAAERAAAPQLP